MKLYVNEKIISFNHTFYVRDAKGTILYEITSKIISFGDKTTITRYDGQNIAYIEQELLHLTPNYKIFIHDKYICNISKKFNLFRNDYILSNNYKIDGEPFNFNFTIYDNENNIIGNIQRQLISLGDKYEINIYDDTKLEIILAIIVAISNDVNRSQRMRHHRFKE